MRSNIAVAGLGVLLLAVGCNLAPHHRDSVGNGGVAANTPAPTVDNLIEYLNGNAARVKPDQAVTCRNVMINVNADGTNFGVDARMICQAPHNFRMSGVLLSSPVVEVGSNDKEFWFWSREMKPNPYLFHCSYDALAQGVNVPLPFQPDMVVKALGLAPFDRTKQYTTKVLNDKRGNPRAIELIEQAQTPDRKPIQKVTVFNFHQADPQIIGHILRDEKGKVICEANIRTAQRVDGINGPIIPRMVEFRWPEQKLSMQMRIENPSITAMPAQKAAVVFNRQDLKYQSFDLATQTLDGPGVQQAGGTGVRYRP